MVSYQQKSLENLLKIDVKYSRTSKYHSVIFANALHGFFLVVFFKVGIFIRSFTYGS